MSLPLRGTRISRRSWLLAGLAVPLFRARGADSLAVTFDGDTLHVSAPGLHFLTGAPLERLKAGSSVVFISELTLFADAYVTALRRVPARCAVSYDIWNEDKFSVTALGQPRRSATNLSAAASEAWCLENLTINVSGMAPDRRFWLRLDLATAGEKDELSSKLGQNGISLRSLILLLGRKPETDRESWTREAGPLRLADLARLPGRGRNG